MNINVTSISIAPITSGVKVGTITPAQCRVYTQFSKHRRVIKVSKMLVLSSLVFLVIATQAQQLRNEHYVTKVEQSIVLSDLDHDSVEEDKDIVHHDDKILFLPPGCPNGQLFCENPPGYPSREFLEKLIPKFSEVEQYTVITNSAREEEVAIDSKFSVFSKPKGTRKHQKTKGKPGVAKYEEQEWFQESPVCDSRTSYVYPKAALNKNLHWRYIFNLGNSNSTTLHTDYVQVVKVETCLGESKQCNIATYRETTVCRQKFAYHRLVALDTQGQKYIDTFKFPSCCVCHKIAGVQFRTVRREQGEE